MAYSGMRNARVLIDYQRKEQIMAQPNQDQLTWKEDPADIIVLSNKSKHNYILDLPAGRMRLDAGRRMKTLCSILKIEQVQTLVNEGMLNVEKP